MMRVKRKEKEKAEEPQEEEQTEEEQTEEEQTEEQVQEEESTESAEEEQEVRKDSFGRTMYKAKCADCGKDCEVPFKPDKDRPVYCRDCFSSHRPKRRFNDRPRRF